MTLSANFLTNQPFRLRLRCANDYNSKSKTFNSSIHHVNIPARDRVIEFGKHKGRMLGTLPSSYLKWVSNNLRAREFEEWAKFADQVLEDPVYQDRLEWEFASNILQGNYHSNNIMSSSSAVSELLQVSERFGWDNEDKVGWSKVNFDLLGTTRGGRIPRLGKVITNQSSSSSSLSSEILRSSRDGRRRERRERARATTITWRSLGDHHDHDEKTTTNHDDTTNAGTDYKPTATHKNSNHRFPGREGLLKKVLHHKTTVKQIFLPNPT